MNLGDAPNRASPVDPEPEWCPPCQEQHHDPCPIPECAWCGEKHSPICDEAETHDCCHMMRGVGHTRECNDDARGDELYDLHRDGDY